MSKKLAFYMLFLICLGMMTEVFFTTISDFITGEGILLYSIGLRTVLGGIWVYFGKALFIS